MHFSEKEKIFFCYGCRVKGDIFDFVGLIKGSPGYIVFHQYVEKHGIDIDCGASVERPRINIQDLNFQLSVALREHIKSSKNVDEPEWAEVIFKRIDDRFTKLTNDDFEEARNFYLQIMMEMERRQ